ncbi:MAG: HAMP domain-containing histidine kinase [Oscillospiraceae bacterium]|jgi:signal transduction histidine kinase|nr:HAMP domain-containing histidine kinase [Oscillospiraceae bacterium]
MRRSIYFRNFIVTACILLMSFTILGGLFSVWSYQVTVRGKREAMSQTARETLRSISALGQYYNYDMSSFELRVALSTISRISGFDALIADSGGVVISCSDETPLCAHLGETVPQGELAVLLAGHSYAKMTSLGGVFAERRYVIGRLITTETASGAAYTLGYLFLSVDSGVMVAIWRQFAGIFMLVALAVMGLTFTISLVTTKKQTEPINEMARAARRFARGDFAVRVGEPCREDEIGELAQAFNAMADAIQRSETRRREFIANVSHELKTPMTVIAGFADGILDGTVPPENEQRYLGVISSETRRLSRLVRSMLDMSHLQSMDVTELRKNKFDIAEVLRVTLLGIGGKLEDRRLDAETELPEETVLVFGDKDSVTQVVYNLLDNAVKFAAPGSAIRLALWKQGGRAFVSVENHGETIPEEEMPLIFDRFHKTDKSRSGSDGVGLGLYIVKTILDNHNEDIFVTSGDGVTKFVFTLTIAGRGDAIDS